MYSIHLFGPPQILLAGQPVAVERRKSRALLYYLAAAPAPQRRETLLALFWPDIERPQAQQVLRTSLHGLRKDLGEGLAVEREMVGLSPDVWVDARQFEQSLTPLPADIEALSAAVDLYRGPFLEGFSLPDAPEFEDWLVIERERMLRTAVRALSALSRANEAAGDYPAALAAVERALALDTLQEDLQRESMRLLYLAGDRAGAIRRYDQLRRLLDDELGVPPMAETRSLYDEILNDRLKPAVMAAPVRSTPPRAARVGLPARGEPDDLPFASRSKELASLRDEVFSHRLLLVEGEPGVGKTRLVEHFLSGLNALTLRGAAHELEASMPYRPLIEALRGLRARPDWDLIFKSVTARLAPVWLDETARLLPELKRGGQPVEGIGAADEWRLWEGVSQFIQVLADQRPVVLFLDDLHWADPSTLGLLGYLVRQPSGLPLGFVAAARPPAGRTPLTNLLQALTRERLLLHIPLTRLSLLDLHEIAAVLGPPEQAPILADWMMRVSEGNPYILAEVVRDARQRGQLTADGRLDPGVVTSGPALPASVYSLIQSRLARLSEPARRILDVAVALGRDFDFDVAVRAAAMSEEAGLDALDELTASRLIYQVDANCCRFDHSLTMEVAYRETGEARHRRLHHHIAAALEGMGQGRQETQAGLLAFHFSEGNDPRRAAPYALRAGRQAVGLAAWQEAAAYFQQALAGATGWDQFPVLLELGDALGHAGEAARSSQVLRTAVDLAEEYQQPLEAARARLALGQSFLPQARYAETAAEMEKVLASGDRFAFQAELWWGTALSLEGADLEAAQLHLNRAAERCRAGGDQITLAQVEFELGSLEAQKGNLQAAVDHYREALALARQSQAPAAVQRQVLAYNNLAYHLLLLGDPEAESYARRGMKLSQEQGQISLQPYLYSTLGEIALANADFTAAEMNFTTGLALAQRFAVMERVAGLTANLGLTARARGQTARAVEYFRTAMALSDQLRTHHLSAQVRIWLAPLLPRVEALSLLDQARQTAESGGRKRLLEEINRLQETI